MSSSTPHYDPTRDFRACVGESRIEVIRLVREILRKNPSFTDFYMAMGTWTFYDKDGIVSDDYAEGWNTPSLMERPSCKRLLDFMDEWDHWLHLSGHPLHILADGTIDEEYEKG